MPHATFLHSNILKDSYNVNVNIIYLDKNNERVLTHVKCRVRVLIFSLIYLEQSSIVIEFVSDTVYVCMSVCNLLFVVECLQSMHLVLFWFLTPVVNVFIHIFCLCIYICISIQYRYGYLTFCMSYKYILSSWRYLSFQIHITKSLYNIGTLGRERTCLLLLINSYCVWGYRHQFSIIWNLFFSICLLCLFLSLGLTRKLVLAWLCLFLSLRLTR